MNEKIKNLSYILLFLPFIGILSSCTTVPYTERNQFIITSENEEIQLGQTAWNETLKNNKVSTNKQYNDTLERVGTRLASAVDKNNYNWEFIVIESDTANAFCLPGGKIAVYSEMFKVLDNDAELAAVVGHEIAHAVARHGGERITHLYTQQLGSTILSTALAQANISGDWSQVFGIVSNLGVILPYSRTQEYEADHIGMIIMAKAGYTPNAAVSFWEKYSKLNGYGAFQEFFATHPMGEKRLKEIKRLLPEINKNYYNVPGKSN